VGQHVLHHGAQAAALERDPRAVGGEHAPGLDVAQVAEDLGGAGGADLAEGVDLERVVVEVGVVDLVEGVDRVAAAGDDPVEEQIV